MTFNQIINNISTLKLRDTGNGFVGKISDNAPLATLISPVIQWYNQLKTKLSQYDCLASAFSSCESVINEYAAAELPNSSDPIPTNTDRIIEVSEEEFSALHQSIKQVEQALSPGEHVTVTSVSGLAYYLSTDDSNIFCRNVSNHDVPVAWKEGSVYKLRVNWPSTSSSFTPSDSHLVNRNNIRILTLENCQANTPSVMNDSTVSDGIISLARSISPNSDVNTIKDASDIIGQTLGLQDESVYVVQRALNEAEVPQSEEHPDSMDSFLLIADGLVQSGTINGVICDSIEAMQHNTLSSYFDELTDSASDTKQGVKLLVQRLRSSYRTGGIRGFLLCLIRLIKGQASVRDENGIFVFADNNALVPKEFLVGIIGTVISAVASVVGLIASMIAPIAGAIISSIGSLAWSVIGSAKSTYSDTKASALIPIDDYESISMVPYSPISLLQGVVPANNQSMKWYREYYEVTNSCAMVSVPGGAMFVGPGEFAANGTISKVKFEFHPFSNVVNGYGWYDFWSSAWSHKFGSLTEVYEFALNIASPDQICYKWRGIISDPEKYDTLNNDADGTLSVEDDSALLASTMACTGVFIWWLTSVLHYNTLKQRNDFANLKYMGPAWTNSSTASNNHYNYSLESGNGIGWCMWVLAALADAVSSPAEVINFLKDKTSSTHDLDWKNFINCCKAINESNSNNICSSIGYISGESTSTSTYYVYSNSLTFSKNPVFLGRVMNEIYNIQDYNNPSSKIYSWNIGDPLLLPDKPIYAMRPPGINASTYWLWAVLGIAVTTAVTIGAVVGAVKFNKWRKTQQFKNTVKANNAREKATAAMNGQLMEKDPETGEPLTFDVNSPEGQGYINSCMKDYKRTCRVNNIMAHLIGGTRYDYTSFYGDASEENSPSDVDSQSRLKELVFGSSEDSESDLNNVQDNVSAVITLIKG